MNWFTLPKKCKKVREHCFLAFLEERKIMQLIINSETIQVHIQRSKRKTVCLSVNKDNSVTVKAPLRFPSDREITEFVQQKAEWIFIQRQKLQKQEEKRIKRRFETGYTFPYLGEERLVEMQDAKKTIISYQEGTIRIKTQDCENVQKLRSDLKKWYKKQAKEYITKRVEYYQPIIGVTVTSISIKSRKSQWGSCDSNGNLTFSWRLVMARPEAIDYVVVHELCHRKHMDHSRQFWNEVQKYMPDFKEQKKWLEENSVNLNIE